MWKTIARECNASFDEERVGEELSVEELVFRDEAREKPVGGSVIKNMALQYGIQPIPSKGYVICDIDGTIADCQHRMNHVRQSVENDGPSDSFFKKDWKGFFSKISEDALIKSTAKIVIDYYNKMHTIIYVSARPEEYRDVTLEWLKKNNMALAWTLIMRPSGDKRPDVEVKQDIYDKYLKKYPIEVVIDDRPRVLEMWKRNGLKTIDVGDGIDF
jgi:hypothetical protein